MRRRWPNYHAWIPLRGDEWVIVPGAPYTYTRNPNYVPHKKPLLHNGRKPR